MNKPDIEFIPFPKLPRFRREVIISEKIDGTNAGILIEFFGSDDPPPQGLDDAIVDDEGVAWFIYPSSRKRWIVPGKEDNAGFARWVEENSETLIEDLGPGMHFGEWWGNGIQRNYGLDHKRFSLFNTSQWNAKNGHFETPNVASVPVIASGILTDELIETAIDLLNQGSYAVPGWMNPEGIAIFHVAANKAFKFTLDGDGHKDYRG